MLTEGNDDVAGRLVDKIRPILAGHDPDVQSTALGDLFAMYLAGHVGAMAEMREDLIRIWLDMVRDLVALYDQERNSPKKNSKKK